MQNITDGSNAKYVYVIETLEKNIEKCNAFAEPSKYSNKSVDKLDPRKDLAL